MEVPKEDAHRLLNVKAKIETAKERLGEKKRNIDLMEALLDSWLDASDVSTLRQFQCDPDQLLNLVNNPSESTSTSLPHHHLVKSFSFIVLAKKMTRSTLCVNGAVYCNISSKLEMFAIVERNLIHQA